MMNEKQFWDVIRKSRLPLSGENLDDNAELQMSELRNLLERCDLDDVASFEAFCNQKDNQAYTYDLWGAAHLYSEGCSDDFFAYFRTWLIFEGEHTYAALLENPDLLGEFAEKSLIGDIFFEEIAYVASSVYESSGKDDFDDRVNEKIAQMDESWKKEPTGQPWESDLELAVRYPNTAKLAAERDYD